MRAMRASSYGRPIALKQRRSTRVSMTKTEDFLGGVTRQGTGHVVEGGDPLRNTEEAFGSRCARLHTNEPVSFSPRVLFDAVQPITSSRLAGLERCPTSHGYVGGRLCSNTLD